MTEPNDHLADALHQLHGEIRDQVRVPAAADLRARATRALRVRRATTAVIAAATVAAIALGGNTLLRPIAGPPEPPTHSPTPSPRPAPRPVEPVDHPITEVDWSTATIRFGPREGCPEGPVEFVPDPDRGEAAARGPAAGYPRVITAGGVDYGDLTGDGIPEAVLAAQCLSSEDDVPGSGNRLLMVAREDDGTLTGLGWTGHPTAWYQSQWIADGRLFLEANPSPVEESDQFLHAPGLALTYRWDGNRFISGGAAPEYPPMLPLDHEQTGPPVQMGAVGTDLGCSDGEVRFTRAGERDWSGSATANGATYTIPFDPEGFSTYLYDLDRTGERLLVTALRCERADGSAAEGLAVFERAGDGWQGISVLLPPEEDAIEPALWLDGDVLRVIWENVSYSEKPPEHRWTGTVLEPLDEIE